MHYKQLNISQNNYTKHFLRAVYILTNVEDKHVYGCVPNGEIGISVILEGEAYIRTEESWCRQPPVSVYGLIRKVQFHHMQPGYREVNIGFAPEYLQLLIKDRVSDLTKRNATDLHNLLPESEVRRIFEELQSANTDKEIVNIIGAFLERNLRHGQLDRRAEYCLNQIRLGNATNINSLSRDVNISPTSIRNIFSQHVGIAPKELIKIHRVKAALMRQNVSEEKLTSVAYLLGYYDQSHFIHEFKEAVGLPPKEYFASELLTFDFYNFQRWRYNSFAGIKID